MNKRKGGLYYEEDTAPDIEEEDYEGDGGKTRRR